jgi:hypothetical protein
MWILHARDPAPNFYGRKRQIPTAPWALMPSYPFVRAARAGFVLPLATAADAIKRGS